jgi:CO dehydrogenase/acetyl-CoA synthase beta subunit
MSPVLWVFSSMYSYVAHLVGTYEIHCSISATGANHWSVVESLGRICISLFKNMFSFLDLGALHSLEF